VGKDLSNILVNYVMNGAYYIDDCGFEVFSKLFKHYHIYINMII